jgi:hypothetical protein
MKILKGYRTGKLINPGYKIKKFNLFNLHSDIDINGFTHFLYPFFHFRIFLK